MTDMAENISRPVRGATWQDYLELTKPKVVALMLLTTVIGMLPLALNPAEGAELMAPLAVVVIGGLMLSTALTLFVIPCLYLSLTTATDWLHARFVRR